MNPRAVVLLSGGLDSTTTLAWALDQGFEVHALTFDYGQRHREELHRAREIASALGVREHRTFSVDLASLGGSALTDDVVVPKDRDIDDSIPVTYVPARNTVFLSIALAWAETLGARDILYGANSLDYSGYPDCRPAFLEAFERLANLATKEGVESGDPWFRIHAPLMTRTKADIVRLAGELGVDLSRTISCYDPGDGGEPCGRCDACVLRARGFGEANVADPARGVGAVSRETER